METSTTTYNNNNNNTGSVGTAVSCKTKEDQILDTHPALRATLLEHPVLFYDEKTARTAKAMASDSKSAFAGDEPAARQYLEAMRVRYASRVAEVDEQVSKETEQANKQMLEQLKALVAHVDDKHRQRPLVGPPRGAYGGRFSLDDDLADELGLGSRYGRPLRPTKPKKEE